MAGPNNLTLDSLCSLFGVSIEVNSSSDLTTFSVVVKGNEENVTSAVEDIKILAGPEPLLAGVPVAQSVIDGYVMHGRVLHGYGRVLHGDGRVMHARDFCHSWLWGLCFSFVNRLRRLEAAAAASAVAVATTAAASSVASSYVVVDLDTWVKDRRNVLRACVE